MKAVILAGGSASTISDEEKIPKPMAEVGGYPILWHIMKSISSYGITEFVICSGYKSEIIKRYFAEYYMYQSDILVDLEKNEIEVLKKKKENWKVTVLDTGLNASVTERIKRAMPYVGEERFFLSYGDCVSDIDINVMLQEHQKSKKQCTISVAHPIGRNRNIPINEAGLYDVKNDKTDNDAWVDAGLFIFEPSIIDYLDVNSNFLFETVIPRMAANGEINTYKHEGFWSSMETKRDQSRLESKWLENAAPWKVWKD